MDSVKLKEIEELAIKKEKEWKNVTSLQLTSLQTALTQKENEHKELCEKFRKLKEDFKYNLKLLQDRDKELKTYDESFAKTKTMESAHVAAISDLKIKIAKLTDSLEREEKARCEMQRYYRQRLIDQQAEMEAFRSTKDAEVEETLSQLSKLKSHHERLESQLRSEIEAQKFEFTSELENALVKKDRENRENEDKVKAEAMAHQLKCKLLEKELDLVKSAHAKQSENLLEADEASSKLKKKLLEAEHDVKDVSSIKNARILELEPKVQNLESKNSSLVEDYEYRRQQLDKDIRLQQSNMDTVRQKFLEKEKSLEEEIRKLQSKAETCEHETRRALWDKNDMVKEHQVIVENLKKENEDLTLRFENQVKIHGSTVISKDVEIQNSRKKEDLMRNEIEKLKNDIEKYKKDLASATQKENLLLQSKVQLKMDWQQRCQEIERKQYTESEALIQSLTKSRDNAVAEVRKLRRKLGIETKDVDLDENNPQVEDLQKQNDRLKKIIEQMTSDMQKLATGQSLNNTGASASLEVSSSVQPPSNISIEYVKSLEKELMELKRERRNLPEKEDSDSKVQPSASPPVITASFAHPDVKSHINSLNKMIGNLRSEKTDLSAQLQKIQVRLRHQESILNTRDNDSKHQLGRIQELEYELSSNKRRREQESQSLKRQISDLELQLAEARREADEYYRGGIQNNLRATELGNQLSQMKVDVAAKTPWMGGITQAGIVQQLQSEITELRKELTKAKQALILGHNTGKPTKAALLNKHLHEKLKLAAEQISRLLQEKSQLLEVGNSLRSELATYRTQTKKIDEHGQSNGGDDIRGKGDGDKIQNKLKQMEDLQYQLTRQELQYAQRVTSPRKYKTPETPPSTSTPEALPNKDTNLQTIDSTSQSTIPMKPLQYSLSSVGDSSLKDVWNMLDQEPSSPSVPGSKENSVDIQQEPPTQENYTKKKITVPSQPKQKGRNPWSTSKHTGNRNKHPRTAKIRNYNIEDDEMAKIHQNYEKRRL